MTDIDPTAAVAAFQDVIEFWHRRLDDPIADHTAEGDHPERPTTAREYFHDRRGWSDETIDTLRLGWAPPGGTDTLIAWLHDRGHDRDAILATGLVGEHENGRFWTWEGRYIIPYPDVDGEPVYAIGRCTGQKGGGKADYDGHPADFYAGKYAKVRHTDERVPIDEPIWGLHTLTDGVPVVIAEGIADAISAAAAGYSVLSPVAKEFKAKHITPLVAALTAHDVPAVYVVPDADPVRGTVRDDAPTGAETISAHLDLPQVAPGRAGALRTAARLTAGLAESDGATPPTVRVAPLPQPDAIKVDLDDYLTDWQGDLTPVLASAKPAPAFPEFKAATRQTSDCDAHLTLPTPAAEARTDETDADRSRQVAPADPHRSSLWALDVADVTPAGFSTAGDRGRNPAAHCGESENYFVLRDGRDGSLVATDYKAAGGQATYNALTYLLVAAGVRDRNRPQGSLSDREIWTAWQYARETGILPLTDSDGTPLPDPIPLRALWHLARTHELAPAEAIPTDYDEGSLPTDAYAAALDLVQETYGLDPERTPPGGLTSALPLAGLEALSPAEQRRAAKRRGVRWPSTDAVCERISAALTDVMRSADTEAATPYSVLEAPTGSNKTGVAAETRWTAVDAAITGNRPVVLFCETRAARDEAVARAETAGSDVWVARRRTELCPLARGDYDPATLDTDDPDAPSPIVLDGQPISEWFDDRCDCRGIPVSVAHAEAEDRLARHGRTAPCCTGEQSCPVKAQWPSDGLADDAGQARFDLVIATDPFAFVPSLRAETNVIHDEQPDYTEDFGLEDARPETITATVRQLVTAFLSCSDRGPKTFEELVVLARQCASYDAVPWNEHAAPEERPPPAVTERWYETFDALGHEPDRRWYFTDARAHTLAPALARAIWSAITGSGDPTHSADGPAFDANGRVSATVSHTPPRLDDAHETAGWNRTWATVVIDDENQIRRVRNAPDFATARAVVGLDARPTAWCWQRNVHPEMAVKPVLDREERRYWRYFERGQTVVQVGEATRPAGRDGQYFTEDHARAIVTRLRNHFGDDFHAIGCPAGFEGDLRELLQSSGVPEAELATMHFGEEKSRNDFAELVAGLVYGCIDPGDDYVLDWLAECGLEARPERSETPCSECAGGGCPACDGEGYKRARGRGFEGPDAEHAAAFLESVRATHVAQMVGRFGRRLDVDAGERNLTFVATDALPADLVDVHVDGVQWVATPLQREITTVLEERPSATTSELAAAVDCTKEHVRRTLMRLAARADSPVQRRRGAGAYGADSWRWQGGPADDVQLGLDEIANTDVQGTSTWALAIARPADAGTDALAPAIAPRPRPPAETGADPPPD